MVFLPFAGLLALFFLLSELFKLARLLGKKKQVRPAPGSVFPSLSIIVPARNEEKCIGACVASLLQQDYPGVLEIIVVDDNSTDSTAAIVSALQEGQSRLRLIASGILPAGWAGKTHACHVGAQHAGGDYLCFFDADGVAKPNLFTAAIAHAQQEQMDVLSLVPRVELRFLFEKILLLPLLIILAARTAQFEVLNGGFLMFRRKVYAAIGGHTLVKMTVTDDLDFAAYFQGKTYRAQMHFAEKLFTCQMYRSFASMKSGMSKMLVRFYNDNIWYAGWTSFKYLWISVAAFVLPLVYGWGLMPGLSPVQLFFTLAPALLFFALCAGLTIYFRIHVVYALLIPLGWLYQPAFFLASIRNKWRRRLEWHGRSIPVS